jgi:hypothetical protein
MAARHGYDDKGNLFADGSNYDESEPFELAELHRLEFRWGYQDILIA